MVAETDLEYLSLACDKTIREEDGKGKDNGPVPNLEPTASPDRKKAFAFPK